MTVHIDMEEDKEKIFKHINTIFEAFSKKDRETLLKTHLPQWKGFTVKSRFPLHNREEYLSEMESILKGQQYSSWEILDEDIAFYEHSAIVCYIAIVRGEDRGVPFEIKLRIMDVYIKQNNQWNLASSNVSLHPDIIDRYLNAAIAASENDNQVPR